MGRARSDSELTVWQHRYNVIGRIINIVEWLRLSKAGFDVYGRASFGILRGLT